MQLSADRPALRVAGLHRCRRVRAGPAGHARDRACRWREPRRGARADRPAAGDDRMNHAYICDAVRTPIGRYGGILSAVRADDLGALPLRALLERNPGLDPAAIEEVFYGCANQAGEDNRNVARMSLLLAGLPAAVSGVTDRTSVVAGKSGSVRVVLGGRRD